MDTAALPFAMRESEATESSSAAAELDGGAE